MKISLNTSKKNVFGDIDLGKWESIKKILKFEEAL